jgi:hypothetical protein
MAGFDNPSATSRATSSSRSDSGLAAARLGLNAQTPQRFLGPRYARCCPDLLEQGRSADCGIRVAEQFSSPRADQGGQPGPRCSGRVRLCFLCQGVGRLMSEPGGRQTSRVETRAIARRCVLEQHCDGVCVTNPKQRVDL